MSDESPFFGIGSAGSTWLTAMRDPYVGYPPWQIAWNAPPARVASEARSLEGAALGCMEREPPHDMSARALQGFANACWVAAVVAWLEGRA